MLFRSDLARASLFSPWYSYRLFRDCLGLTPTEYIRKYRLTEAAKQLRSGEVKVIDAAMDAGFTNVDTFTRAFYREFGLNPSDYMKNPVPVPFFIPYGAKYRELRKENIGLSKEPLNKSAATLSGSFAPTYRFENFEIRKGFLQFPNLNLVQNPSLTALAI